MSGRRLSTEHLNVVIPHEGHGYAVVVSKKVARLSVARHLLKRRVLAALRAIAKPPTLIVFPKAGATSVPYATLHKELTELLSKTPH